MAEDLIKEPTDKCTMQRAQNAAQTAKFRLLQPAENQCIVATVSTQKVEATTAITTSKKSVSIAQTVQLQ